MRFAISTTHHNVGATFVPLVEVEVEVVVA
jgi:hypothetical protein